MIISKKFILVVFILCAMFGSLLKDVYAQEVVMLCTQSTTPGTPPSCVPVDSTHPLPVKSN